jgi:hypothetical protein
MIVGNLSKIKIKKLGDLFLLNIILLKKSEEKILT